MASERCGGVLAVSWRSLALACLGSTLVLTSLRVADGQVLRRESVGPPQPGLPGKPAPAAQRYYGKYRGRVIDNADPSHLGRIRANVPSVLGGSATAWALPAFPYGGPGGQGLFMVPEQGANVWIEFEGGDPSLPIWSGVWFTGGAVPDSGKPARKVLRTRSGHEIVLDDDAHSVQVQDSSGNTVKMDPSGITVSATTKVTVTAPAVEVTAGSVTVNSAMAKFSGVVQADTLIAKSVVSASYSPGAGNLK